MEDGDAENITLVALYKILYFTVEKWVVSGVFHRRYKINTHYYFSNLI